MRSNSRIRINILNTVNTNNGRGSLVENFNARMHQERRLESIIQDIRGQPFELTNTNLDRLVQRSNSNTHRRSILNSTPDPIGAAVQQVSNWQLGRTRSPFFNDVGANTFANGEVLRGQLSRHVGYNAEIRIFRATLNFFTHNNRANEQTSALEESFVRVSATQHRNNNHFVTFNRLVSDGSSQNNLVLISFNTFTHTRQHQLDDRDIGLDSLPNLRLNTISNNDFALTGQAQQILTNTVIVPERFLNLGAVTGFDSNTINNNANSIIPELVDQRISSSMSSALELSFGRPYVLLERPEQYGLLINRFQSIQSTLSMDQSSSLNRAIILLQDDLNAFEQSQITPLLETQINALVLLNSTPSLYHQELIFDNFRRAYTDYVSIDVID